MWPQGYFTGSPYPGSPLNEYGSLQQYQQQQVLPGMSRQQQVLFLPMLKALVLHSQDCHLTAEHHWHHLYMLTVPYAMQALQVRHAKSTMQCSYIYVLNMHATTEDLQVAAQAQHYYMMTSGQDGTYFDVASNTFMDAGRGYRGVPIPAPPRRSRRGGRNGSRKSLGTPGTARFGAS